MKLYQYYSNQLYQKEKLDFGTIKEASEGLGFSEHGLGKAYPQVGIELVNISYIYIYIRYNP